MKRLILVFTILFCSTFLPLSALNGSASTCTFDTSNNVEQLSYDYHDSIYRDSIIKFAYNFIGCKYVWGAIGPKVFDCSGFSSFVMKTFNINIFRTADSQYTQGISKTVSNAKPADLIFFKAKRKRIGHVGIVTGHDKDGTLTFIHATRSAGVEKQRLAGYYLTHFAGIKDVLSC